MDILKNLLSWLEKPSPRIAATVLLAACAALLLLRYGVLPSGVTAKAESYQWVFWLSLIIAAALLLTYVVEFLWRNTVARRKRSAALKKRMSRLRNLTVEERRALQPIFEQNTRTLPGHPEERVLVSLVVDGILFRLTHFSYRISDEAWEFLRNNPDRLATPDDPRPPLTGHEWMAR